MRIKIMYNRKVNELEHSIYKIGASIFADNNKSEDLYIYYGKYGKTFFISKNQGIISDVQVNIENSEWEGDIEPIYLNEDERNIIDYTLDTYDKYEKGLDEGLESQTSISREQLLIAIMKNLEVLLVSKVMTGEFEPNLKKYIMEAACKYSNK